MPHAMRLLSCMFLAIILAGCVESTQKFYSSLQGEELLPEKVYISNGSSGNTTNYWVKRQGTRYVIESNSRFNEVTFIPLPQRAGFYIAQLRKSSGGYNQSLISLKGRELRNHVVNVKSLKKAFPLSGLTDSKSGASTIVKNRPALEALFQAAAGHPSTKLSRYTIYDLDVPEQRKAAAVIAKRVAAEEKKKAEQRAKRKAEKERKQGKQAKQPSGAITSAGKWRYSPSMKLKSGKNLPVVYGTAVAATGGKSALLSFRCGRKQPLIGIKWGVPIKPIMDDGKKAFTAIEVQFDQRKPDLLVFKSSKDKTFLFEMADIAKPMFAGSAAVLKILRSDYERANASWNAGQLTKLMRQSKSMTLQAKTYSGEIITARYKTQDFAKVIQNFPTHCR